MNPRPQKRELGHPHSFFTPTPSTLDITSNPWDYTSQIGGFMFTLESKGRDPREKFYLLHVIRMPDTGSLIAVALHARTRSPIDATISLQQVLRGLEVCCQSDEALWYREQLTEHNLIEPKSAEGTAFCVSPNELIQFGFKQDDVCRIVEQNDWRGEQVI
jgi:hypothetical protein